MAEKAPPPPKKVRTPLSQRLRHWRLRYLPLVVWLAAIGAAAILLQQEQEAHAPITGFVETREVFVGPLADGVLRSLEVDLFDEINEETIIARMDDSLLLAELETARAELRRLQLEPEALRARILFEDHQWEGDQQSELREYMLEEEEARLDLLDRQAELEIAGVELRRLEILLERQRQLLDQEIIDPTTYEEVLYAKEAVETRIRENKANLDSAREVLQRATTRREAQEERTTDGRRGVEEWIAPLAEAISVQQSRLAELSRRQELLLIRAPISGQVTAVKARAGQTVLAGVPILTITSGEAERIVAYVHERMVDQVAVGSRVEVQTRRQPREVMETRVARVGGKVDEFPVRLQNHPLLPQWGLAILIEELPSERLFPGELLDIRVLP